MNHGCIFNYPNQNHSSTLKKVSEINKEKISTAKKKRVWMEICIMNHKARFFRIILLLTRITFTLTHFTKG